MNNTTTKRNVTIVAVFMAATLMVGTFATVAATQFAFAYSQKKPGHDGSKNTRVNGSGGNSNKNGNTVTIEECKNRGSAGGFDTDLDQECENLICTHPGNNATCTQEGVVKPKPKLTCEQCLTTILNSKQITDFETEFGPIADTCVFFMDSPPSDAPSEKTFKSQLQNLGIPLATINELIACLKDAGIVFT
jgi:hypothetical protein